MGYALPIALAGAAYALFAWSNLFYFQRGETGFAWPMRLLAMSAMVTMITHLAGIIYFQQTKQILMTLGELSLGAGIILHVWALVAARHAGLGVAYSDVESRELVTHGPYAVLQHPVYVSYCLVWLGGAFCTTWWWAWTAALLPVPWYVAAIRTEQRDLEQMAVSDEVRR